MMMCLISQATLPFVPALVLLRFFFPPKLLTFMDFTEVKMHRAILFNFVVPVLKY